MWGVILPADKVGQFARQLKYSLQDNNDIKDSCHIGMPVQIPAYTIFLPAQQCVELEQCFSKTGRDTMLKGSRKILGNRFTYVIFMDNDLV